VSSPARPRFDEGACFLTHSLSGRIWIVAFSAVVATSPDGRSECRWYLSLELGEHSPPTTVNANLVILGSSDATEEDPDDTRTIYLGHPTSGLSPGRDKAIKIRLDDGPIGSHLLNEFVETNLLAVAATKYRFCLFVQVVRTRRFEQDSSRKVDPDDCRRVVHRYFECIA
jgi:hypothetical protein